MQKVLFIGLDGAGKTSLYQKFFGKKTPNELISITPTRGIAKYSHDFLRSDVEILDLGGSKDFRQNYIGNRELVQGLSAIVYFLDVQDVGKYQEAANYLILWTKSVVDYLKGVKGYILFNKIDPGTEAKIKNGLQQLAGLIAPLDTIFPGGLTKSITTIYNDSSNQILQRILLDTLPKKMSKPKIEETIIETTQPVAQKKEQPIATQPPKKEEFITKPITSPPVQAETKHTTKETSSIKPPSIAPPKLNQPVTSSTVIPNSSDISKPMAQEEAQRIREKTAERLTDIIEASLDNNHEFTAIAVYTEDVECVVGAVQQGANPEILKLIELTLQKINLEEYMSRLGKVRIGGEGHFKIDTFDIFFEKVSPEHLSTIICSSIQEDSIANIQQLNRYLNQALSVTPEGVDSDSFRRADLIAELKMRLYNRGKSVDHVG